MLRNIRTLHLSCLTLAVAVALCASIASAQEAEKPTSVEPVVVVGSHIRKAEIEGISPVLVIDRQQIENSGLVSIGDVLQQLTSSGKSLNSKFNFSGNVGGSQDGSGVGAGAATVDLRHLDAKRVLVLLDGHRWVNESSGSGIGGAADLNTIPLSIVDHIEVLGDGASSIYGSDAIAGVINIVTRSRYNGAEVVTSYGAFTKGDGETTRVEGTLGGNVGGFDAILSLSAQKQDGVRSIDRDNGREQIPGTGNTRGSPSTPQGRFIFLAGPNATGCPPIDLNGDGKPDARFCDITSPANAPVGANGTPAFPAGYIPFTLAENFNPMPFNLMLTPNERKSAYASLHREFDSGIGWTMQALFNRRESSQQAAPQPITLGSLDPTGSIGNTITISHLNPFNPTGIDLASSSNLLLLARRPLEAGPRIFEQEVDTSYLGQALAGSFNMANHYFLWDAHVSASENKADQIMHNAFDLSHIKLAVGDPAACAAVAGCVPLNLFGGQGADGAGTITPQMLGFVRATLHDRSEQKLETASANMTGDLLQLPAGALSIALGSEYRRYRGSYTPDELRTTGAAQDLSPAQPSAGSYHVGEVYAELSAPLLADQPLAKLLEVDLAARYSDYSNFGSVSTPKAGFKWNVNEALALRGSYTEGFRAPVIGELYGSSQLGAKIVDRCSGFSKSNNAALIAGCTALGVPPGYTQIGTQIFTTTGGSSFLQPEHADSYTLGTVYSPTWAQGASASDKFDVEVTYYHHSIKDAIQAPDAQFLLDSCVASGNKASPACFGIKRAPNGQIVKFDNFLQNIGGIETDGADIGLDLKRATSVGDVSLAWHSTWVHDYTATDAYGNTFPRNVGVELNDGAIPRWQSNFALDWQRGDWSAGWTMRYINGVRERCSDSLDNSPVSLTRLGVCSDPVLQDEPSSTNRLGAVTYHDLRVGWRSPFGADHLSLNAGLNNAFDKAPPLCTSCSINGYDAATYDLPGRVWYLRLRYAL